MSTHTRELQRAIRTRYLCRAIIINSFASAWRQSRFYVYLYHGFIHVKQRASVSPIWSSCKWGFCLRFFDSQFAPSAKLINRSLTNDITQKRHNGGERRSVKRDPYTKEYIVSTLYDECESHESRIIRANRSRRSDRASAIDVLFVKEQVRNVYSLKCKVMRIFGLHAFASSRASCVL